LTETPFVSGAAGSLPTVRSSLHVRVSNRDYAGSRQSAPADLQWAEPIPPRGRRVPGGPQR
jgi:hypothetical protein